MTDQAKLNNTHKRALVLRQVLLSTIFTLIAIEIFYAALDPNGTGAYIRALQWITTYWLPDETGYTFADGYHDVGRYSFTFANGTRLVPNTNPDSEKTLVFIGDSVAFGMGVKDEETFINRIAQKMPKWHVINAALPSYNIKNIEALAQRHKNADCIIYIAVLNDYQESIGYNPVQHVWQPSAIIELKYFIQRRSGSSQPPDFTVYLDNVQSLIQEGIHVIAFKDNPLGNLLVNQGMAFGVSGVSSWVAPHDPHPSVESHAELADEMLPAVKSWCK